MKRIYYINLLIAVCAFFSCTPMDHYYSEYIPDADIIYPGKADSIQILPGYNRAIINCLLSSDPKVVKLKVYWQNRQSSLEKEVALSDIGKRMDIAIDPIAEGSYNFEIITFDTQNNSSVVSEAFGRIYGDKYAGNLNNRVISSSGFDNDDNAFINWISENSANLTGTELQYTKQDGSTGIVIVPIEESTTLLPDYKVGTEVRYRAMYLPVTSAIDVFYSNFSEVKINRIVNVALNKSVIASDILDPNNATQKPANAVDGKYGTSDPRWVSTATGDHWLEIDLETEYSIHGFKTWNGAGGYNNPISSFKLQVWVNNDWIDVVTVTDNNDALYGADFTPVTTNKVRFYTYNQVRLYEIEIYSIIND